MIGWSGVECRLRSRQGNTTGWCSLCLSAVRWFFCSVEPAATGWSYTSTHVGWRQNASRYWTSHWLQTHCCLGYWPAGSLMLLWNRLDSWVMWGYHSDTTVPVQYLQIQSSVITQYRILLFAQILFEQHSFQVHFQHTTHYKICMIKSVPVHPGTIYTIFPTDQYPAEGFSACVEPLNQCGDSHSLLNLSRINWLHYREYVAETEENFLVG